MPAIEKTLDEIEKLLLLSIRKIEEIKARVISPQALREELRTLRDGYFRELREIFEGL